jgi:hypothetical protein
VAYAQRSSVTYSPSPILQSITPPGQARHVTQPTNRRVHLTYNPHVPPPSLPVPPLSPELRSIALSALTPQQSRSRSNSRSSSSWIEARRPSVSGSGTGSELSGIRSSLSIELTRIGSDRGRLSGSTVVDEDLEEDGYDKLGNLAKDIDGDTEAVDVVVADAEEAKVNRKVSH